jgi:hypothetical protein
LIEINVDASLIEIAQSLPGPAPGSLAIFTAIRVLIGD